VLTHSVIRTRARLVVGIVTDRLSCTNQLITEARNLKKIGFVILGIVYTQRGQVDLTCVRQIVTANQYLEISDYSQYSNFISDAVAATCPPDYWGESFTLLPLRKSAFAFPCKLQIYLR